MHYKMNWLDLSYNAAFRGLLFDLAANPVPVLAAVHSKLSTKYNIAANDLVVESGANVGDVRARLTLFSGNGTIEIRADGFSAKFSNPTGPTDGQIITDCIQLTQDALSEIKKESVSFQEESVILRMFIELLDSPMDGPLFLRSLLGESKCFGAQGIPLEWEVVPGFQIEFIQDDKKWAFIFNVSRSIRSRKELFISTTTRFLEGHPFQTFEQKAQHLIELLNAAFARSDLQKQPIVNT